MSIDLNLPTKTFAELTNPHIRTINPLTLEKTIKGQSKSGYPAFSLDAMHEVFFSSMAALEGDSLYGVGMNHVQRMLGVAMADSARFAQYLSATAREQEAIAKRREQKYASPLHRIKHALNQIPLEIELLLGILRPEFVNAQKNRESEKEFVAIPYARAKAYDEMARTVEEIGKAYPCSTMDDITTRCEFDHPFSGIANGTGTDVTFADEQVREYGHRLYASIHKIWHAHEPDVVNKQ
jgi:hypothetical protein